MLTTVLVVSALAIGGCTARQSGRPSATSMPTNSLLGGPPSSKATATVDPAPDAPARTPAGHPLFACEAVGSAALSRVVHRPLVLDPHPRAQATCVWALAGQASRLGSEEVLLTVTGRAAGMTHRQWQGKALQVGLDCDLAAKICVGPVGDGQGVVARVDGLDYSSA